MGKPQSKTTNAAGDPQVEIINNMEQLTNYHEQNQLLLIVIVAMLALSMSYAMLKKFEAWQKREAFRAARSLANINDV